jgi:aromatic amino acid aminotransferase I / 2-aminoadipate transaminase
VTGHTILAEQNARNTSTTPSLSTNAMSPFTDTVAFDLSEDFGSEITLLNGKCGGVRRARDWTGYLTEEARARRPSALKAAFKHLSIPGIISLGGGLPLPTYFPIYQVDVHVPSVGKWSEGEVHREGTTLRMLKYHGSSAREETSVRREKVEGVPVVPLSTTLQYGVGTGDATLVAFLKDHTEKLHHPPYEDWSTTLTCGSTYSFYSCLRMLLERGDFLVMEEYTYSSAISTCGPMGIKIVATEMDSEGMIPRSLDKVLSQWDEVARKGRKPRVVYLVPSGSSDAPSNH